MAPLAAQTFTAAVAGVAKDSSGALIAGAAVAMTNIETDVVQHAVSNEAGLYRVDGLAGGHRLGSIGVAAARAPSVLDSQVCRR